MSTLQSYIVSLYKDICIKVTYIYIKVLFNVEVFICSGSYNGGMVVRGVQL
jgi:hypothetical protein